MLEFIKDKSPKIYEALSLKFEDHTLDLDRADRESEAKIDLNLTKDRALPELQIQNRKGIKANTTVTIQNPVGFQSADLAAIALTISQLEKSMQQLKQYIGLDQ